MAVLSDIPGEAEQVSCAICGADSNRQLFMARDKVFYGDGREYPVVECRQCGLVYLNPRPGGRAKAAYYENEYPFCMSDGCSQPLAHYQPVIDRLMERDPGRVLDVGTGNSPFLPEMKQLGWEAAGTEVAEPLADHFREQHGITLHIGELEDIGFEDDSFDAVTVMGVLEHVPHPRRFLEEVRRILRDGGLMALWCFNRGLEARLLGRYWLGFDTPRHFYSFSYDTMLRLLAETGFELKGSLFRPISYASYSGVWAYQRARNRLRAQHERMPTYRLHLPAALELVSRPLGRALAARMESSNMFLFAEGLAGGGRQTTVKEMEARV
ncbi:MAG: class I SAM-dependent methyltransferase [Gaiellales bacterium]|nr:MAG: class I SAM-dependent methyltransferase [Gaiellales bacterium]